MSIDAIRTPRRYEPTTDSDLGPSAQSKMTSSKEAEARRDAYLARDSRQLEYPRELFSSPGAHAARGQSCDGELQTPAGRRLEYERSFRTGNSDAELKASGPAKLRTNNPNEVEVQNTRPIPQELVAEIRARWPALTEEGAIALAAQSSMETGHWTSCWNWNFGNAKELNDQHPHMYLGNTWEGIARRQVKDPEGNARLETDDEVLARLHAKSPTLAESIKLDPSADHAHAVGAGSVSILFSPPHPTTRFVAHSSMAEGLDTWLAHMKKTASDNPEFLTALNTGDATKIAHALKQSGYYTAAESAYAAAISSHQKLLRRELGIQ